MISRNFKLGYQQLLSLVFVFMLPIIANCNSEEVIYEKRIGVAMRMIGHELLTCWGDYESRILPIEKIDGQYKISFESKFGIDPDDLATIINPIMQKTEIATHYLVVVEQCESKDVVHSFEIRNTRFPESIACTGRGLPKDCYNLLVTIFENKNLSKDSLADTSLIPVETQNEFPFKSGFLIFPLLFVIGFIGYFMNKKNPTISNPNPNIIMIGATHFDKKNSTLSFKNKSIELSHKEAGLLSVLHASTNEPIERAVILQKVWGDDGDYVGRTLDVFISKLRKKLESDMSVKIVNIRGVGYKLVMDV